MTLMSSCKASTPTFFLLHDKVRAFHKKVKFWKNRVLTGSFTSFPQLCEFSEINEITLSEAVKIVIREHLENLESNFLHYFPNLEENEDHSKVWILNPFNDVAIEQAGVPELMKEKLFELSTDSSFKNLDIARSEERRVGK